MTSIMDGWRRMANGLRLRRAGRPIERIRSAQAALGAVSDQALLDASLSLRYRAQCGEPLPGLLVDGFALVREASRRTLGIQHFDVQLLAGVVLSEPAIAEMQTGEGKTVTALLPLYLRALGGRGAHLATANDYLAERDARTMRPVFSALGMTVGVVVAGQSSAERRSAFACDVTYGTVREFAFDFLRDRLRRRQQSEESNPLFADGLGNDSAPVLVQRPLHYLLADEADCLMIDEARTPLIISAASSSPRPPQFFRWAAATADRLEEGEHFGIDHERRLVELSAAGRERVRSTRRPADFPAAGVLELYEAIEKALQAARFFRRETHYIVSEGRIVIVDEFTGRPSIGRQWREGLHQAIEAREGLEITPPGNAAAQITTQEFFAQYPHLGGLTGTALPSAGELRRVYGLSVVPIPTHRPCLRQRLNDRVLKSAAEKWDAIVEEVQSLRKSGRPILIGTRSIDKSETLAERLAAAGIPHRVLHARQLAGEAEIVARAGEPGAVTVATNMAGRGTDIVLGPEVARSGGLHIICSELHDAIRVDRQLAGRCARQGDPGTFRQYLSLDDEILDAGLGHEQAGRLRDGWSRSSAPAEAQAGWFYRAQRLVERRHRADRRLLIHNARLRRELHERLGQDPFLDSAAEG